MPPPQYTKLVPLHQHPGAKPLDGSRAPSLIERASKASGEIIDCAQDLVEADRRLMAAASRGVISHREWSTAQECILRSWQIRQQARLEEPRHGGWHFDRIHRFLERLARG